MTLQERIAYINARGRLLQFFLVHMYSNNTELFNAKNEKLNDVPFLNDMEPMKYFIDRSNQYYDEETYDFIVSYPPDASEHQETHDPDIVENSYIHEISLSINVIKEYLGLSNME